MRAIIGVEITAYKDVFLLEESAALRPPPRLVIAVLVIGQAAQVSAVDSYDVDLTTVYLVSVKVGGKRHPLTVWRKGWTL